MVIYNKDKGSAHPQERRLHPMKKQPDKVALVPALVISPLKDEENEKETIINALKACNGHREQAARLLKINPSTLYRKMNKYRLK